MEKRGIRIFCVTAFAIALMTLAGKGGMSHGDAQEENASLEMQGTEEETEVTWETEVIEQESVFDRYQMLNKNLLRSEFLNSEVEDTVKSEALEYAKEVKEEFTPELCENSSFPEELVVKLEEIWHRSGEQAIFYAVLSDESGELGPQDFRVMDNDGLNRLFPRANLTGGGEASDKYEWISRFYDISKDTSMIEHIELLPGKDNYVFEYFETRLRKNRIRVTERIGDKFVTLYEFDPTPIEKMFPIGVIRYEDGFYYIVENRNINVQHVDEIIIYRLGYDSPRGCMRILYQPKEYVWKENVSDTDNSKIQPLIEAGYIDQVMRDFSSGKYLHEGSREDGAEIYCGDEKPAYEIMSEGNGNIMYKVDFANCGISVYLRKEMEFPVAEGSAYKKNLAVDFFYYNSESDSFQKLEELSIPEVSAGSNYWRACLVQMWFKEVEGKVYTFRVYHLSGYNYMMSIALVDGEIVRPLKRYFLLPREKFVVEEKKAVYQDEEVVQGDEYFKVTYLGDFKYHYALYDKEGKIVKEGEGQQPLIEYIDDTTILLETSGETEEKYTVYYDTESGRLSETYVNVLTQRYGKVVYMDSRGEEQILIVRNIFDREYYEEFPLDFESEPIAITYCVIHGTGDAVSIYYNTEDSHGYRHEFELNVD